jgi:SNF2 family DNA or RNA helicase
VRPTATLAYHRPDVTGPPPIPQLVPPPDARRGGSSDGEWDRLVGSALEALPDELACYAGLVMRLVAPLPQAGRGSYLVEAAAELLTRPGFETFVSLPRLRFSPFTYQLKAAGAALRRMRGRAILADEVGLGKTIEAGLVLSELYLRRLAARVLLLVPSGLVEQWREELDRKFGLPALVQGSPAWERAERPLEAPILIVPLAAARRKELGEQLAGLPWDLVIVDEAHRLKNPASASARLVRSLRTRYLLLLTATPVENRLDDLFQLVNLVRPGHLGTAAEFRARHVRPAGGSPGRIELLQERMREVMVRHRRSEVALMLPRRLAETRRITPGPEEAELYGLVSANVRRRAREAGWAESLALRVLQRLAGSSPQALAPSLERACWWDLADRARQAPTTRKAAALVELLRRSKATGEKVVVFTAFRETLEVLAQLVEAEGIPAARYHGSLSRRDKEEAVRSFQADLPVLLSTEAAGEGRNLQFCHSMVNFDLPWNPMQIEQRLGRIHRIGQDREVLLTNLVTRGTVEERVFGVLEAKINLFELVIGELDMILGRIEDDFDFESSVFHAYVQSDDDGEFERRLEALGDDLARARSEYLESRSRTDDLVPELHER